MEHAGPTVKKTTNDEPTDLVYSLALMSLFAKM